MPVRATEGSKSSPCWVGKLLCNRPGGQGQGQLRVVRREFVLWLIDRLFRSPACGPSLDNPGGQVHHCAVAVGQLVVAGGHGPKLLEVSEVILDQMASPVADRVVPMLDPPVDPWRNGFHNALRGERQSYGVGIVGLVGDKFACEDAVQESG